MKASTYLTYMQSLDHIMFAEDLRALFEAYSMATLNGHGGPRSKLEYEMIRRRRQLENQNASL